MNAMKYHYEESKKVMTVKWKRAARRRVGSEKKHELPLTIICCEPLSLSSVFSLYIFGRKKGIKCHNADSPRYSSDVKCREQEKRIFLTSCKGWENSIMGIVMGEFEDAKFLFDLKSEF
jgi:hypothetical protein